MGESRIDSEAAAWVSRLDRAGDDPAVRAEHQAWLEADRRHQGAFLRAEAMWRTMDRARALHAQDLTTAPARFPPARFPVVSRRLLLGGAAAGAAAAVAAGVAVMPQRRTYRTAAREIRRVQLADGSVAAINSETEIEVVLTHGLRRVRLIKGDAWFQVAKDASRPFVVESGGASVRAVGTAFSVRRDVALTEVLVSEGVVELASAAAKAQRPVRVGAGSRTLLHLDGRLTTGPVSTASINRRLAWREAQIALDGDTLAEAVESFNRYNRRRLVVLSPELNEEPLVGWFWMDDPVSFAEAVGSSLGAKVEVRAEEIRLSRPSTL